MKWYVYAFLGVLIYFVLIATIHKYKKHRRAKKYMEDKDYTLEFM